MDFQKQVEAHHSYVKSMADEHKDYQVIFTAAVGSQNYDLASENSDCDTFTIVLPNYMDFISNTNLISFETNMSDGKCVVKDFRLMMNLLRKTSPNSIEVFASHYKVIESEYNDIALTFFNPDTLFYLIHANYQHMLHAIAGMAKQVHGRNMTEGKRYSHILRISDMALNFLNNPRADQILSFCNDENLEMALNAKLDTNTEHDKYYLAHEEKLQEHLQLLADNFTYTNTERSIEYTSNHTINRLQFEVTKKYLELNGFEYRGI